MKQNLSGALVVLASAAFGCANSTDARSEQLLVNSRPIQGGQEDPGDANVLGLFMTTGAMCTGTLIAPNLVLTARHCLAGMSPDLGGAVQCGVSKFQAPIAGQEVYVSTDMQLTQNGDYTQGAEVSVPGEGNDGCGFDVALIRLSQNLQVQPRVPRIDLEPQAGEPYKAVGYGIQGTTGWGGTRMALDGLTVQCNANDCPSYSGVQSTEFMGDTGVCSGDSGGPAIDANGKVMGVVSRGLDPCASPTYGSVSAWRNWIMAFATDAATKGGYAPPYWALSGQSDPPPPPDPIGTGGQDGGGAQGQICGPSAACPAGYGCLTNDNPEQGQCTAFCDANAPCGSGLSCDSKLKVCISSSPARNGTSSGTSSGCALASADEADPGKTAHIIVGALLALAAARRRRHQR